MPLKPIVTLALLTTAYWIADYWTGRGGSGGSYGAGGGSGGYGTSNGGRGGDGTPGLIVLTYIPSA